MCQPRLRGYLNFAVITQKMIEKSAKVGKLHLAERNLNQEKTPLKVNVSVNVNENVSTQKLGRDYSMSTVMVVDDSVTCLLYTSDAADE